MPSSDEQDPVEGDRKQQSTVSMAVTVTDPEEKAQPETDSDSVSDTDKAKAEMPGVAVPTVAILRLPKVSDSDNEAAAKDCALEELEGSLAGLRLSGDGQETDELVEHMASLGLNSQSSGERSSCSSEVTDRSSGQFGDEEDNSNEATSDSPCSSPALTGETLIHRHPEGGVKMMIDGVCDMPTLQDLEPFDFPDDYHVSGQFMRPNPVENEDCSYMIGSTTFENPLIAKSPPFMGDVQTVLSPSHSSNSPRSSGYYTGGTDACYYALTPDSQRSPASPPYELQPPATVVDQTVSPESSAELPIPKLDLLNQPASGEIKPQKSGVEKALDELMQACKSSAVGGARTLDEVEEWLSTQPVQVASDTLPKLVPTQKQPPLQCTSNGAVNSVRKRQRPQEIRPKPSVDSLQQVILLPGNQIPVPPPSRLNAPTAYSKICPAPPGHSTWTPPQTIRPPGVDQDYAAHRKISGLNKEQLLYVDPDGETLLMHFIAKGHYALFDALLTQIVRNKDIDAVEYVNRCDKGYRTALYLAVYLNEPWMVKRLVECGADVNKVLFRGNTRKSPLFCAVMKGDAALATIYEIVSTKGVQINQTDNQMRTPLHCAIDQHLCLPPNQSGEIIHSLKTIDLLLRFGAKVTCQEGKSGKTAMHSAVECRQPVDVLKILISHLSPTEITKCINSTNYAEQTCLHIAAGQKMANTEEHDRLIELLLHYGADKCKRNRSKQQPRDLVTIGQSRKILHLLEVSCK